MVLPGLPIGVIVVGDQEQIVLAAGADGSEGLGFDQDVAARSDVLTPGDSRRQVRAAAAGNPSGSGRAARAILPPIPKY
jgi:hypothetical protein